MNISKLQNQPEETMDYAITSVRIGKLIVSETRIDSDEFGEWFAENQNLILPGTPRSRNWLATNRKMGDDVLLAEVAHTNGAAIGFSCSFAAAVVFAAENQPS